MLKKVGRHAQINDTSSSSEPEQPAPKKGKITKRGEAKTPEVAIEFEEERPPSIIDVSSNTTESEVQPRDPANQGEMQYKTENKAPGEKKRVEKETVPVKATTSWQIEKRSSERFHVPPKTIRYRSSDEAPERAAKERRKGN